MPQKMMTFDRAHCGIWVFREHWSEGGRLGNLAGAGRVPGRVWGTLGIPIREAKCSISSLALLL